MKPAITREIYPELKKIEGEIMEIKMLILRSQKMPKKPLRLEGVLKGVRVDESEVKEAKQSLLGFERDS